jgi:hypothetical protein
MVALTYLDYEKLACELLEDHSFVRPRRRHSSVPTAIQVGRRVERRSRMAAIWRPPKGLVLDGREHGGNVNGGGRKIASTAEVAPDFKLPVPGIPTDGGKRKWEAPSESVKTATSILRSRSHRRHQNRNPNLKPNGIVSF